MAIVIAKWADDNLKRYGKKLQQLHEMDSKVLPRIVNQVGNLAKTQVIRALATQTGLPQKTIRKAIGNPMTARVTRLSYEMRTRGGNIRLKYLDPKEKRQGVTAKPWGKRRLFAGTFMRGGRFPNRVEVPSFDGHVYRRLNRSGTKITQARSGMFIPVEMTKGATRAAFLRVAEPMLQQRVEAALRSLVP